MKYIYIILIFICQNIFGQTIDKKLIIGKWKMEKIVISPEIFFDLSHKDSTRENIVNHFRQSSSIKSISPHDSLEVERIYNNAMSDIELMFFEFKVDGTYLTCAIDNASNRVHGIETGTFSFNPERMELNLFEDSIKTNIDQLKIILLNKTTLLIVGKDGTNQFPKMTYKRQL